MNSDRIDVLDSGTVWQGGQVDAAIDQPPFEDPLLVVAMDRGEDNDQFIDHATVEAVLSVWIEDQPSGCLKDQVLVGLADAVAAWLADSGNVYLHCKQRVTVMGYTISSETHDKLEANRRAGRLCAGGTRHCTTPATVSVQQQCRPHKIGR